MPQPAQLFRLVGLRVGHGGEADLRGFEHVNGAPTAELPHRQLGHLLHRGLVVEGGREQCAAGLGQEAERRLCLRSLGDVVVHEHDLVDDTLGALDRVEVGLHPADTPGPARLGGVVTHRRKREGLSSQRAAHQLRGAVRLEVRVLEDVVRLVDVVLERLLGDSPQGEPRPIDAQRAAVARDDLQADRRVLEDPPEARLGRLELVRQVFDVARLHGRTSASGSPSSLPAPSHVGSSAASRTTRRRPLRHERTIRHTMRRIDEKTPGGKPSGVVQKTIFQVLLA